MGKLTQSKLTRAFMVYARKHGFSVSTVRTCTSLRLAAIDEQRARDAKEPRDIEGYGTGVDCDGRQYGR